MRHLICPSPNGVAARLESVLAQARRGEGLGDDEVRFLLSLTRGEDLARLFHSAREVRRLYFGSTVFLYGFIYFSTFCRNDCNFCFFRRSSTRPQRYRKTTAEVLEAAGRLAAEGVHLIDLTMGEDPVIYEAGPQGFEALVELAAAVRRETGGIPVMASPGAVPERVLQALAGAGVDWYACYQETHRPDLFARLRPGQSYIRRWEAKRKAKSLGLLVEEGILSGVGETLEDVAGSIAAMRELDADQVRVMSFIPQADTPMAHLPSGEIRSELHIIAVLRLAFPSRLIPASLDVEGLSGLRQRLDAGANVVTSLIAPGAGLAGVAHSSLDVENGRRTAAHVIPILQACGLIPAGRDDYLSWMEGRRRGRPGQAKKHRC
jgi:methylornithine synthase